VFKNNKLLFYIVINMLISTATVLVVLWFWDRAHPMPTVDPKYLSNAQEVNPTWLETEKDNTLVTPDPTSLRAQDQIILTIEGVFGVGIEQMEYVLFRNHSGNAINLLNWQLTNGRGDSYTFPALTLNADGRVKLMTGVGTNSVIELFWGLPQAIWHTGDTVTLKDTNGITHAVYQIP